MKKKYLLLDAVIVQRSAGQGVRKRFGRWKSGWKIEGIEVIGCKSTESGKSLCKLFIAKQLININNKQETEKADSFFVLTCGLGIHTVMATTGKEIV